MVSLLSKMEEWLLPTMSMETIGILGVLEHARQRAFGGFLHSGVDLLDGDLALKLDRQVDHGAVGRGNARGEAVELALPARGGPSDTARAAPVVVGIMDMAAARARRRSLCGRSKIFWSLV